MKAERIVKLKDRTIIPWPKIRAAFTITFFVLAALSAASNKLTVSTSFIGIGEWGIACPLGVAQVILATRELSPVFALGGLLGVVGIMFSGRFFCSWICPGRFVFNQGPTKNSKPWKHRKLAQRLISGGVLGAAFACHNPVFCTICPAGVACRGAIAAGTGGSLAPTLAWFGVLLGTEWATGQSWCRDLCPLGATISQLSALNPFIKVRRKEDVCRPCKACQKACPMGLNLSKDTDFSSCTKCFACQSACPRGAVTIALVDIGVRQDAEKLPLAE